jgi:hypothetical protein
VSAAPPDPETFLAGRSGNVSGRRMRLSRGVADRLLDLRLRAGRVGRRLDELAAATPGRKILAAGPYRPRLVLTGAVAELQRTRHDVRLAFGSRGDVEPDPAVAAVTVLDHMPGGKWDNINLIIEAAGGLADADWLFLVDDDVVLPDHFLDRFVAVCERFDLAIAQPAQTLSSHAAWDVARRHAGSIVRETRFVEIGPVTVFRRDAALELMPFPEMRWGWGLDLHWAAVAGERGWRLGIVDALPVKHTLVPIADAYSSAEAIEEARRFLTGRPYVHADVAKRTVATHRSLER